MAGASAPAREREKMVKGLSPTCWDLLLVVSQLECRGHCPFTTGYSKSGVWICFFPLGLGRRGSSVDVPSGSPLWLLFLFNLHWSSEAGSLDYGVSHASQPHTPVLCTFPWGLETPGNGDSFLYFLC